MTDASTDLQVVVRDVFPAEVIVDGEVLARPARVLITRGRVFVFEASNGRPRLAFHHQWRTEGSTVPDTHAPKNTPAHLILSGGQDDGKVLHVNRAGGCGCGNPLKAAPLSVLLPDAVRGTL